MKDRTLEATVDSISEGVAVLDSPEGVIRLPANALPDGTREGDRVRMTLSRDADATRRAKDEIRDLRRAMTGGKEPPDVTEL